nr:hypothetical protein [Tanacetum cinerariifolium]
MANRIERICHVGLGLQDHMGCWGSIWYCSGALRCTGECCEVKGKKGGKGLKVLDNDILASQEYGRVIDAFIPNRRSKSGANDGYKSSAGVLSNSKGFSVGKPSYVGVVKQKMEYKQVGEEDSKPSLVLDGSCFLEYDYSLALKGEGGFWVLIEFRTKEALVKFKSHVGVGSWFSSLDYASNSFVIDERVVWVDIEGVSMKMWTSNTFNKISSKWGELLFDEDKKHMSLYKVSGWVPDFLEEEEGEDESDDDTVDNEFDGDKNKDEFQAHSDNDWDIDAVLKTNFSQSHETSKQGNETRIKKGEIHSEDPFNIYDLLLKKPGSNNKEEENSNDTLKYPPSFTLVNDSRNNDDQDMSVNMEEHVPKQKTNAQGNVSGIIVTGACHNQRRKIKNLIV